MGDTGSLAIGSGLAALCLLLNLDLLLPILGGLFVLETLSVIAQVVSFRVFDRRIFRMAPFHHHFELLGWPETTVIVRFWILAGSSPPWRSASSTASSSTWQVRNMSRFRHSRLRPRRLACTAGVGSRHVER